MDRRFTPPPWLWLLPALAGGIVTALILFVLPHDRVIDHLGEFLFKTLPLLCAVATIALFPREGGWQRWLVLLGVIFYMGYVDSAFIIHVDRVARAAVAGTSEAEFPRFYTFNLFVNSFTVLFALFAYRLGGGRTETVLKLGVAAILVMLSGLNDLTMWLMYPWADGRPATFDWASHVIVFIGRVPSLADMLGFLAIHLLLAILIMVAPLRRWLLRESAPTAPTPAREGA